MIFFSHNFLSRHIELIKNNDNWRTQTQRKNTFHFTLIFPFPAFSHRVNFGVFLETPNHSCRITHIHSHSQRISRPSACSCDQFGMVLLIGITLARKCPRCAPVRLNGVCTMLIVVGVQVKVVNDDLIVIVFDQRFFFLCDRIIGDDLQQLSLLKKMQTVKKIHF